MLFASLLIQVIVTGHAVRGGRCSSDDRHVIWIGQGGHCAFCGGVESRFDEGCQGWCDSVFASCGKILWVEAIDADDYCWTTWKLVGSSVDGDWWFCGAHVGSEILGELDVGMVICML